MPASTTASVFLALLMLVGSGPVISAESTSTPAAEPLSDEARRALSQTLLRQRGLPVCRLSSDGKLRYHGLTLGSERQMLNVQITAAHNTSTGEAVAGFHETRVWDQPANWQRCEH